MSGQLKIEVFPLGPVLTNAYLLYDSATLQGLVIDPGMQPRQLMARIASLRLEIQAILLTHAHFDHIGGLEELRKQTGSPVYIHEIEQAWLTDATKNGSALWPGVPEIVCQPAEHTLDKNEELTLGPFTLRVIHTPGHSPGSVTYLTDSYAFCGDVLFKGSVGRTDLPGGDYQVLMQTLRKHLIVLPEETQILPGHGPKTTVGQERKTNPFLIGGAGL